LAHPYNKDMAIMYRFRVDLVYAAARRWLVALLLCAVAGCWQEVEYTGPDPASTASAPEASAPDNLPSEPEELPLGAPSTPPIPIADSEQSEATDTSGFANDFADSLTQQTEEPSAASEPGNTLPWPGESSSEPPAEQLATTPPSEQPTDAGSPAEVDKYALPGEPSEEASTLSAPGETAVADPSSAADQTAISPGTPTEPPLADTTTQTESSTEAYPTAAPTNAPSSAATEPSESIGPASESMTAENLLSDATVESANSLAPTTSDSNPRLDAWRLGSKLSLAALSNDRGIASESVEQGLAWCRSLAVNLGTSIGDLPEAGLAGNRPASRQALDYLFKQGQQIGRDLTDTQGAEAAALFEVALKSNLLLVLYTPRSTAAAATADAVSQAARRTQLPADLWKPLMNVVAAKADGPTVRKAVKTFHEAVEHHLAERAEQ
jgi:hypothetical protein